MILRAFRLLLLAVALGGPTVAHGGVQPGAYEEAVRLIDGLYLRPDEVNAASLLHAAARGLADDIDWLLVEPSGNTVYLRHGNGTPIGSLSVANVETLPEALAALEDLVVASGFDTAGVDLRLSILQGLTGALDRYSTVLSGDRLDRFDVRLKGTLVGVGLTVVLRGERLTVTNVMPDGPAAKGGVKAGDKVVRIDGVSTLNMTVREASRRIRGEPDSDLTLTVERGGRTLDLPLTRQIIVVPNVEHRALAGGVGYVRITHFSQRTDENLGLALAALREEGALGKGLVIDLRGNTGGSMKDSARSADAFVHEGLLLRTVGSDGGTVRNLQSRMEARSSGDEPEIPVVVLMDRRTASGSEIMAGALLQLDRAALVGSRSFGKGTVQKVYPIDPEARLKLTVARYLLAGSVGIGEEGLKPDLALADVILDDRGMRFHRFTEDETGAPFDDVVPVVHETPGWRGRKVDPPDIRLEVARRAVLESDGPGREAVVKALREVAREVRAEQDAEVVDALGAHGIDWNLLGQPSDRPVQADVRVIGEAVADEPGAVLVRATVANREAAPLERAVVVLHSESFPMWNGVAMPIGRIGAGETASGVHTIRLRAGVLPREDDVVATLRVAGRPQVEAESVVLRSASPDIPELAVTARVVPASDGLRHAEVTVHNLSDEELTGVEVAFGHPGDIDVELKTQSARIPTLAKRASARVNLDLQLGPGAPAVVPLGLSIEADTYGDELVQWPVDLPVDGTAVSLQAPRIDAPGRPLSAPTQVIDYPLVATDETRLDHVVVYANGEKIDWAQGGRAEAKLTPKIRIQPGENVIVVVAADEQGVQTRKAFRIRGDGPATADAEP